MYVHRVYELIITFKWPFSKHKDKYNLLYKSGMCLYRFTTNNNLKSCALPVTLLQNLLIVFKTVLNWLQSWRRTMLRSGERIFPPMGYVSSHCLTRPSWRTCRPPRHLSSGPPSRTAPSMRSSRSAWTTSLQTTVTTISKVSKRDSVVDWYFSQSTE